MALTHLLAEQIEDYFLEGFKVNFAHSGYSNRDSWHQGFNFKPSKDVRKINTVYINEENFKELKKCKDVLTNQRSYEAETTPSREWSRVSLLGEYYEGFVIQLEVINKDWTNEQLLSTIITAMNRLRTIEGLFVRLTDCPIWVRAGFKSDHKVLTIYCLF